MVVAEPLLQRVHRDNLALVEVVESLRVLVSLYLLDHMLLKSVLVVKQQAVRLLVEMVVIPYFIMQQEALM